MEHPSQPNNHPSALLSLIFGLATILSACTGFVPIPFTGFLCFPLSFLSALLALIFGIVGLNQSRAKNQPGSAMAWAGIVIGGLVFLCALCVVIAFASLFLFAPDYTPTPILPDLYQF